MVEVFRTNVDSEAESLHVLQKVAARFAHYRCNFDLEDCDHVFRISTTDSYVDVNAVVQLVEDLGFTITPLEDCIPTLSKQPLPDHEPRSVHAMLSDLPA